LIINEVKYHIKLSQYLLHVILGALILISCIPLLTKKHLKKEFETENAELPEKKSKCFGHSSSLTRE